MVTKWMHGGTWWARLQDGSMVNMNTEKAVDLLLRLDREVGGPDEPETRLDAGEPLQALKAVDPKAKAKRKVTRAR